MTPTQFWDRVHRTENGCWLWMGPRHTKGYGVAYYNADPKIQTAHRLAWTLVYGKIPAGLYVCHHCDVPHCVRPDHLWLGTAKDNLQDAARKGRTLLGTRNPAAKLSERDIRAIRAEIAHGRLSNIKIAARFGISDTMVGFIERGVKWGWLQ